MKHIVLGRRPVWLRSILILFLLSGVILSTNAQDPHLSIDLNKVTIKQFLMKYSVKPIIHSLTGKVYWIMTEMWWFLQRIKAYPKFLRRY